MGWMEDLTVIFLLRGLTVMVIAMAAGAHAQTYVTERDDGTVVVTTPAGEFVAPATIIELIRTCVAENGDDPDKLRSEFQAIVVEHAGGTGGAELATALAVFAIAFSGGSSEVIDAIVEGANAGNPDVSSEVIVAAVADSEESVPLQATVEDPAQVSPVE